MGIFDNFAANLGKGAGGLAKGAGVASAGGTARALGGSPIMNAAPNPAGAQLGNAYAAYAGYAAPALVGYENAGANIYDRGVIERLLAGNQRGGLQATYDGNMARLGTAQDNNAVDLAAIARQLGNTRANADLTYQDLQRQYAQTGTAEELARRQYGLAGEGRNIAVSGAAGDLDRMLAYLSGQEGFVDRSLAGSLAGNELEYTSSRRRMLDDASARGAGGAQGTILDNQDLGTSRTLADSAANLTADRGKADISKGRGDAQAGYAKTVANEDLRLKSAGLTLDSTLADIGARRGQISSDIRRNDLDVNEAEARLRDRQRQLENQAKDYGTTASELTDALSRGLERLGLTGMLNVGQIMDMLASNDAQAVAAGQQIISQAQANAGYAPVTPAAPAPAAPKYRSDAMRGPK
jgi:hypothetical protein